MRHYVFLLLAATTALTAAVSSCGTANPKSEPYVHAELYNRYEAYTGGYTAEAKLSLRDSVSGLDTAYAATGGIAFLGSNLERDIVADDYIRHRGTRVTPPVDRVRYTFQRPDGTVAEVQGALQAWDTLIMGPQPTHNFGFTVYPGDDDDVLLPGESLSALFQPNDGNPVLANIRGPSSPGKGYVFPRGTVGSWPLSTGTITFIRRRTTDIEQEGVVGTLTEEVYSGQIPTAVVN